MTQDFLEILAAHEVTARSKQQAARFMFGERNASHEAVSMFNDEVRSSFEAFTSVQRNINDHCHTDHALVEKSEEISERFLRLLSAIQEYIVSISTDAERA